MANINKFRKEILNNKYEVADSGIYLPASKVFMGGVFNHWVTRQGEDGSVESDHNIVVDEGLNYILDVALSGGAANTTHYVGIYKNNYTPVAGSVIATFPGAGVANEATTEYTEATRPTWTEAGVSGKTITNSASPAQFSINTTVSIYGAFLASSSAKGGTTGKLVSAALFSAVRNLVNTDILNVAYTFTIADA